jgi:hypothetical protein
MVLRSPNISIVTATWRSFLDCPRKKKEAALLCDADEEATLL